MQDRKTHIRIHQIAIKLLSDGITSKNYNRESAIKILSRTCTPTRYIQILKDKESDVINAIINEEAECLVEASRKPIKHKYTSPKETDLFQSM